MIKGFETASGQTIMQDHLLEREVKSFYSKLLYDEKAGEIKNPDIEQF